MMQIMMSGGSSNINSIHPNPFTAAQWQELELQALFFKFMMSGHPIPPDLIFSINGKRSFATQPQSQHTGMGWSCFEMGVSYRKPDPEPNRCRRTDGKKWRCSRQTSGDSKYCERHMHRGKSRPTRKLVESKSPQLQSQSNLTSLSSVTTTCDMKPVKDSNFMTFLGIDSPGWRSLEHPDHNKSTIHQKQNALRSDDLMKLRNEKRQRMAMMYHQFIEESPSSHEKRDSWLSLVI